MPLCAEVDLGFPCTVISRKFLDRCLLNTPMDALKSLPKISDKKLTRALQGSIKLRVCSEDRVMMTTAYVAAICHSWIGCNLVNVLGVLTTDGRGSQPGGVWASMQHLSLAISSKQHSAESEPAHTAVMRVGAGSKESTPSGCRCHFSCNQCWCHRLSVSMGGNMYLRQWTKQRACMRSDMQMQAAGAKKTLSAPISSDLCFWWVVSFQSKPLGVRRDNC